MQGFWSRETRTATEVPYSESFGSAWMLTVTAELVAVKSGLGYVLWDSYYFLRYDMVIAAMVSIGLLGFITDWCLKQFMAVMLRWQTASTVQGRLS